MEDLPPEDEYSALVQALIRYYALIAKIGEYLPVPIGLPPMGEEFDSDTIVPAVQRARIIIRDLPLDDETINLLNQLLLDWITAHEIVEMVEIAGPADWRFDALHGTLDRVSYLAKLVLPKLS